MSQHGVLYRIVSSTKRARRLDRCRVVFRVGIERIRQGKARQVTACLDGLSWKIKARQCMTGWAKVKMLGMERHEYHGTSTNTWMSSFQE